MFKQLSSKQQWTRLCCYKTKWKDIQKLQNKLKVFERTCWLRPWTQTAHWISRGTSDSFLSFSEWPWRRWKDFNPQWNFLIPATCHHVHWLHTRHRSQPESSQWASVPSWLAGATSLITSLKSLNATSVFLSTGLMTAADLWLCKFPSSVRRERSLTRKPSVLLCGRRCIYWKGPTWPVEHSCCFCFQPLRTFGICVGPHKEIPQLHFPPTRSPSPPSPNLQGCLTFASKWRAAGTKCFCHILPAAWRTIFISVEHISMIYYDMREALNWQEASQWLIHMPLVACKWWKDGTIQDADSVSAVLIQLQTPCKNLTGC